MLLQDDMPLMFPYHCLCHKLMLGCGDAADDVDYMVNKFSPTLLSLFLFYDNSPVRCAEFEAAKAELKVHAPKLVKPGRTRWLSIGNACKATEKSLLPCLKVLHACKDAAANVRKIVCTFEFISTLHLWNVVLPIIDSLCLVFQKADIGFNAIADHAEDTIELISALADLSSRSRDREEGAERRAARGRALAAEAAARDAALKAAEAAAEVDSDAERSDAELDDAEPPDLKAMVLSKGAFACERWILTCVQATWSSCGARQTPSSLWKSDGLSAR